MCAMAQPQPGGLGGFYQAWYGDATIPRGPKDYLHFWNPASLDESDFGTGGNNATSYNFSADSADGWNMGTDNNKYVLLSNPITNGTSFTVTAWVKPDVTAIAAQAYGTIFADRGTLAGTYLDWQLYLDPPTAGYTFGVYNGSSFPFATNTNFPDNVWTHVAGVCDDVNNTIEVFVNGVSGGQSAMTITPQNVNIYPGTIGSFVYTAPDGANFKYHGSIGKVRFYNRVLSQEEILAEISSDGNTGP
jgi:hypothetical protein